MDGRRLPERLPRYVPTAEPGVSDREPPRAADARAVERSSGGRNTRVCVSRDHLFVPHRCRRATRFMSTDNDRTPWFADEPVATAWAHCAGRRLIRNARHVAAIAAHPLEPLEFVRLRRHVSGMRPRPHRTLICAADARRNSRPTPSSHPAAISTGYCEKMLPYCPPHRTSQPTL